MTTLAPVEGSLVRRLDFAVNPLALFGALTDGGRRPHTMLLESADPESRRIQHSKLIVSTSLLITCDAERITFAALNERGSSLLPLLSERLPGSVTMAGRVSVRTPPRSRDATEHARLRAASPFDPIRALLSISGAGMPGIPESVLLAGLFSYDLIDRFEQLPTPGGPQHRIPDYQLYLADQLVLIDHEHQRTEVITSGREAMVAILDAVAQAESARRGRSKPVAAHHEDVPTDCDDFRFAELVTRLKQHITAGDVYQIVPSRTFTLPCADPFAAYATLRSREAAPYLFYLNTGEYTLFGASPESAVRVDGPAGIVEISPIAGTRPRGLLADAAPDPELDARIEAELRLDSKEQSEHLMLVDLARNDVARVSRPGTRRVADLLRVVRYAHVTHLVSRVVGELGDGLDALHAYQACLNMGTLTGAPKLRAAELLRELEPGYRGHYGGAIGTLMGNGTLDTAIVIRAALVRHGRAAVRTGAGVVADSIPEREADETRRKATAVLRAILDSGAARDA